MKRCGLLVLALFLGTLGAQGFVLRFDGLGNPLRWNLSATNSANHTNVVNTNTQVIRYFLAADAWSTTNTAAELNAVRAAFAQWQSVPGAAVRFEEGGLVAPGVDINTTDNTNVVFWAKSSTLVNGGTVSIAGALGVTFTTQFADGSIREADIALNGVPTFGFAGWFTDFAARDLYTTNLTDTNDFFFVESVALHEIGHLLGLNHSPAGGATMLARSGRGVDAQAGLAADDTAAVRFLYPATASLTNLATLRGQVTKDGAGVFGAVVVVEDAAGNVLAATVTRDANGNYELPALPAGNHSARVTPLDPTGTSALVVREHLDIAGGYAGADTFFHATTNVPAALTAGATNVLNFTVAAGEPLFRLTHVLSPDGGFVRQFPTLARPGQSNIIAGVRVASGPSSGVTLRVTGDGLTTGALIVDTSESPALYFLVPLTIATNATPGARSLVLEQGTNVAYANGFFEIEPLAPDFNHDGLDDTFQRHYFPLFTAAPAGPNADPDGDGFPNLSEYVAGSVPTNAASLLRLESVTQNTSGATLAWQSVAGKRYQVSSRSALVTAPWQELGGPVTATNSLATFLDAAATNGMRFYRVQVLP